ncbi:MAG: hypothetical protein ACT6FE_06425, partial [Methanosarcinaceae archaeon]
TDDRTAADKGQLVFFAQPMVELQRIKTDLFSWPTDDRTAADKGQLVFFAQPMVELQRITPQLNRLIQNHQAVNFRSYSFN